MKFALYDDIHAEFDLSRQDGGESPEANPKGIWTPPADLEVDAILVPGDSVKSPEQFFALASKMEREQSRTQVHIFEAGNHEFGHETRLGDSGYQRYRDMAAKLDKTVFLEREVYRIGDIVVAGCTLWTDLSHPVAENNAREKMSDFKCIYSDQPPHALITPLEVTELHRKSVAFLKEVMANEDPAKTLIATHHSPVQYGMNPPYGDVALMDLYGARLEHLIAAWQPAIWAHGHTHESIDRTIGETRIFNNPRGYWGKRLNPDFDPYFTFELGRELKRSR